MTAVLGTIEGFFGRPYSWAERGGLMRFLKPHGYDFYLYAPKADPHLRRRWREPHPQEEMAALTAFAADCRAADVRFGVGAARRVSAVRWNIAGSIVWAWVVTMPAAGLIAAGFYFLARLADRTFG